MNIVPYTFLDAERLRYGRYPVLDTILYRWARRIEETLFDQARVEVYAGASVVEEMKFSAYYATLRRPRPIYFFSLSPFHGTGLFVVDNRFSAFCLRQSGGQETVTGQEAPKLSARNQARLQRVVQSLMEDFDWSWGDVHPVRTRLKKVTTYPFRARILNPYEPCLVVQIHLSGHQISSRITWCFPRTMLEPVLARLGHSNVLPSLSLERPPRDGLHREQLLERLGYTVRLQMGRFDLASAGATLEAGKVVPLEAEWEGRALLTVEGSPVLVATVGQVQGRYAARVEGTYTPPHSQPGTDPPAFQPIEWPTALPD